MGKYSLDSYQKVDSLVIRPGRLESPPVLPGYGLVASFLDDLSLIPLHREDELRAARSGGEPFALLLTPDEDGWLNTAQRLAECGLQRHWETAPVYARLQSPPDAEKREQLRFWHVRAASQEAGLDADLRLRRATFPKQISSQGWLPLRLWFDNAGPSPLYGTHRLWLRFTRNGESREISLHHQPNVFQKTGDIVYNEIARLPELPLGDIRVQISLRGPGGAVPLNASLPAENGWYTLGSPAADSLPRPHYKTLWDTWYPDGYYPLEDPKEPQGE